MVAAVSFSVTHQSISKRKIVYSPITGHKGADNESMITSHKGADNESMITSHKGADFESMITSHNVLTLRAWSQVIRVLPSKA